MELELYMELHTWVWREFSHCLYYFLCFMLDYIYSAMFQVWSQHSDLVVLCGCCLVAQSCLTLCDPMNCSSKSFLSFTIYRSLRRLMPIESVMPSKHVILGRPLLLLSSVFPSIRVFSNEPALRLFWPKCWSFSFSISPSNEYSRLISFSIDWLNLLAVQGTLKSLLQHHSLKTSVLQCSAFFMV